MKLSKAVIILVMVLAFATSSIAVRPARAMSNTVTAAIIVGGVVAGILVITLVATALFRHDPRFLTEGDPTMPEDLLRSDSPVHFASGCPGGANSLVVCW